jgi:septal ring factor EnvC (AmiA/AmiB activator)
MAMTEDDRLALRARLTITLGEREARVLMEALPPVDYDKIATRDDLETQRLVLQADTRELRTDMNAQFERVDARFDRVDAQFAQVDAQFDRVDAQFGQVDAQFAKVDAEFKALRADMATEFAGVRTEMASQLRITVLTHLGSMIGLAALMAALT